MCFIRNLFYLFQTIKKPKTKQPANSPGLAFKIIQSGIPLATPSQPELGLHSLPPILGSMISNAMPSYSKAPRGLFVLPQVEGIFTPIAISPGPSLRQLPSRYAFDAGQNLPDKEFRYLRTVIVTADVHRRFRDWLAPLPLTFRHWSGVSPYTSPYGLAETCVFDKQSPGIFSCDQRLTKSKASVVHIPKLRTLFCRVP